MSTQIDVCWLIENEAMSRTMGVPMYYAAEPGEALFHPRWTSDALQAKRYVSSGAAIQERSQLPGEEHMSVNEHQFEV